MLCVTYSLTSLGSNSLPALQLQRLKTFLRNRHLSFWKLPQYPLRLLSILLFLSGPVGAYACDTYDLATNRLTIPIGAMGTTVFTDVVVTVDWNIAPVVAGGPASNTYDTYTAATNRLVIPCVQVGNQTFNNVTIALENVVSVGAVYSAPASPVLRLVEPQACATVGQDYQLNVVAGIVPPSSYTYMIDTLAVGNGVPPSMTLNMSGILSGRPFATGGADVNGNQVRHNYTFGVCAVDTLSRTSTTPCPQITVCVDPAKYSLATSVVGSGAILASSTGPEYPSGTVVTLTATPNAGHTFTGWSGACTGTGLCSVKMTSDQSVTAIFSASPTSGSLAGTWIGTWNWSGPGSFGCIFNDGGAMSVTLTQAGTTATGSNLSTGGVESRWDYDCSVGRVDTVTGGTFSLSASGTAFNMQFSIALGTGALSFSGTAALTNANNTLTGTFVRTTGGTGSFTLNRQ